MGGSKAAYPVSDLVVGNRVGQGVREWEVKEWWVEAQTRTHTYTHTDAHTRACARTYTCVRAFPRAHLHMRSHVHTQTHTHARARWCVHKRARACTQAISAAIRRGPKVTRLSLKLAGPGETSPEAFAQLEPKRSAAAGGELHWCCARACASPHARAPACNLKIVLLICTEGSVYTILYTP